MKAAVYYESGPPSVLHYEDRPDPPLHPRGVIVDVQAIGIEGGDVLNRAGGEMPATPHVVGYNCAGIVREVGAEVTDRRPGDRVMALMAHGSHASVASVAAIQTWPVPDGVAIEHAACVPVAWGTAHDCLFEFGRLQPEETVLVQAGAGGVGNAAVQLAKRHGATVITTAGDDAKLARLRDEFAVDCAINYRTQDFVAETRAFTGGRGVDLVVDAVGGDTLAGSIEAARYRGRIISVGNASRGERTVDTSALSQQNRTLTGVFFGAEVALARDRVTATFEAILNDIARGELNVVVDSTYPLARAAEAHARIESRLPFGRVVLIP
jgi:NADPH:quinone reductase